jgi:arabinofuranan 3-O-arabinosyltransferase
MELGHRHDHGSHVATVNDGRPDVQGWTRRVWLAALSTLLVAMAFVQDPGWIVPDTKLDLTANPGGLLSRALVLWDPSAAAGQLQNQGYGYLFPMGPFFWLGDAIGLPAWVIQRLWWAAVLLVGFHGARVLVERLGIGTSVSRLVAAFGFALAPRMLIGLGAVSSEIWPMAMAPWVLVPLIRVSPGGERRAALRSGLAVLLIGAVNATATIAVLIPAGLWILTRAAPTRWRLLGWWTVAVSLASAWWVGPLLLLGRYSPPFLDWIESAWVTTGPASLPEALRGTTQWIAGITGARGPLWIAGFDVLTSRVTVAMGLTIAVISVIGLWRAPRLWSSYARILLVVGLVLVTMGRRGEVTGLGSEYVAGLLDGPLAPFRNTHKFEPLIRIALTLGLAHVLPQLHAWLRAVRAPWPKLGYAVVVLAIVAQTAYPALTGVSQRGRYLAIPDYWSEASSWLADHPDDGRTLVLPGSNPATSVWGDPRDEPLQALGTTPWMVRDVVPLGSAAATRMLNEVEALVATGYGGEELARLLERLGVSRVLLRADLASGGVRPLTVRHALETAGARSVEVFGPPVGGSFDPEVAPDSGMDRPLRAVEIFDLAKAGSVVPRELVPLARGVEMSGGPEGLAAYPERADYAVFSADQDSVAATRPPGGVLTDTLARREATFSAVRDNYGRLLTADEPYSAPRRVHDWLPAWVPEDGLSDVQTTKVWEGEATAAASSSLTDPELGQPRDLATDAARAFDRSGDTAWQSSGYDPQGQWVQAQWTEEVSLPDRVRVVIDAEEGADVAAVLVATDQGEVRTPVSPADLGAEEDVSRYAFDVSVVPGPSTRLRLTVADVRDRRPTVRIRDIGAGDVPRAEPWVAMPPVGSPVEAVLMEVTRDRRPPCSPMSSGVLACNPTTRREGEQWDDLRRIFRLPDDTVFSAVGTVFPRAGEAAEVLLRRLDGVEAEASSQWFAGPSVSAQLVLDGDPRTYWASDPGDPAPTMTVSWPEPRLVTGMRLAVDSDVAGRRPTRVQVVLDDGPPETVRVSEQGLIRLDPGPATSAEVTVLETTTQVTSSGADMPVVIGELSITGEAWRRAGLSSASEIRMPCGFGPTVQVGGQVYPTSVRGTRGQLIAGDAMTLEVCEDVSVPAGEVRARMISSAEFQPRSLRLETGRRGPAESFPIQPGVWTASKRVVSVPEPTSVDSLLVVRENANPGWVATIDGRELTPVTADGWAQGWVVPAASVGEVRLAFTPQRPFQLGLIGGFLAAAGLVFMALRTWRADPAATVGAVAAAMAPAPRWVAMVGVVAAGALLAGGAGALVSISAVVLAPRLAARSRATLMVGLGGALTAWAMFSPWPAQPATNRGAVAQLLAWGLVAVVIAPERGRVMVAPDSGPAPGDVEDGTLEEVPARR